MSELDIEPIKERLAAARRLPVSLMGCEVKKAIENPKSIYRWAFDGTWNDANLCAHAPSDLAALVAEVERMRESVRKFSDDLLFGDGITEPAATLNDMVDPIRDAFEAQHDHIECPIICELCGEKLADKTCEHCHGSGADNQAASAAGAWVECEWCGGAGKIHEGCVEKSYADIATENSALRAQIDAVRAATANHPDPCEKHPEDDPVSCGWKSAYIDVVETLAC